MGNQVTGIVEAVAGPNKGGFYALKVGGAFYNLSSKSPPSVQKGSNVSFSFYLKNDKYKTVSGEVSTVASAPAAAAPAANGSGSAGQSAYWAKREAGESDRDARISYFAAYERALGFVQLAIAQGAFPSLEKAKPAAKLDVLKAFVAEVAADIIASANGKEVEVVKAPADVGTEAAGDSWSE
jgi:hypothetical protein